MTGTEALDGAMHSVWLYGDWRWLTRGMTTEQREAAADAVQRYSRIRVCSSHLPHQSVSEEAVPASMAAYMALLARTSASLAAILRTDLSTDRLPVR